MTDGMDVSGRSLSTRVDSLVQGTLNSVAFVAVEHFCALVETLLACLKNVAGCLTRLVMVGAVRRSRAGNGVRFAIR